MTAEVCVMNTLGVALAADSAVTIGAGASQKIMNSGEKLFQVSLDQPIGALIYGSAVFLGTPWETILKWFRNAEQEEPYEFVEECAEDFLHLLKDQVQPAHRRHEREFVYYTTRAILLRLHVGMEHLADELGAEGATDDAARRAIQAHARAYLADKIKATRSDDKRIPGMPKTATDMVKRRYAREIAKAREDELGEFPLTRAIRSGVSNLVAERLVRRTIDAEHTGVAFAGFGDSEMHPTMIEMHVSGAVLGRPRAWVQSETNIGVTHPHTKCIIMPFAQADGTALFVHGIDLRLRMFVHNKIRETMDSLVSAVATSVGSTLETDAAPLLQALQRQVPKLVDEFASSMYEFQQTELTQPMLDILSVLPKGELGELAETLINITSYRRRVTHEDETVGGPTDVAVITKGDGMIWIRRKHYFEARSNPRYVARLREEHRYE